MVETELQAYALNLLKKKYRISEVIEILVKAGHVPHISKKIVFNAFEELYHGLLHTIRMRLSRGETLEIIKKSLLESGEDSRTVRELLHYVSLHSSLQHKLALSEIVHREKTWVGDWFRIYLIFFLILFTIFTILTLLLMTHEEEEMQLTISDRVALCTAFDTDSNYSENLYRAVCLAVVSKTPEVCHNSLSLFSNDTTSNSIYIGDCLDLSRLLLFYTTHNRIWCGTMDNANQEEFCYQLDENYCIDRGDYTHYCNAITSQGLSSCFVSKNSLPSGLTCIDNYYLYSALNSASTKSISIVTPSGKEMSDKDYWCSKMSSPVLQQFCIAIA